MTSSNGNIFRVTGLLCGEFTGPRWIRRTKASDAELWCLFDLRPNKRLSKQSWGWWFETLSCSLWRHCNEVIDDDLSSVCRCTHDLDRSGSIATGTPYQYSVRWSRTQPALSPLEHWWSYHRKMYHKTFPADHLCHSRIPRGSHCYRRLHTLWRSLLASAGRSGMYNTIVRPPFSGGNRLRSSQNGPQFPDDIFKCIFMNENV